MCVVRKHGNNTAKKHLDNRVECTYWIKMDKEMGITELPKRGPGWLTVFLAKKAGSAMQGDPAVRSVLIG